MADSDRDGELRARFAELRAEDGRHAPDGRAMLERALRETMDPGRVEGPRRAGETRRRPTRFVGRSTRWPLLGGGLAAAAAAVAAFFILLPGRGDADLEAAVSSYSAMFGEGAVRSPTGGLLLVPGIEVVRSVPSIGGAFDGLPRPRDDNG